MKVSMMVALGGTKSLEVKIRVSRWKNGGCKRCMMCERGEHLMLECERYIRGSGRRDGSARIE